MSINNSEKENILNLYLSLNPLIIENIIAEKVSSLQWEQYYEGKRIDLFGFTDSGISIFVENQLSPSDSSHLKCVCDIIDRVNDSCIIIWGALSFKEKHLDVVFDRIKGNVNSIQFLAFLFNPQLLPVLDQLNQVHVLKVMDAMTTLDTIDIADNIYEKYGTVLSSPNLLGFNRRLTERERVNKYIIEGLRDLIQFPNVYRGKRTLDTNKLQYGAGRANLNFEIIQADRYGNAMVSCQFTPSTSEIFEVVKGRNTIFSEKIQQNVKVDEKFLRLYTPIAFGAHKFEMIDHMVEVMEGYIYYLSNYTYYWGKPVQDEMWRQHSEGLLE